MTICLFTRWLMIKYPSGFKVGGETLAFMVITLVFWWLKYLPDMIGTFLEDFGPIGRDVSEAQGVMFDGSPLGRRYITFMVRAILLELFSMRYNISASVSDLPKPSTCIFDHLELFFFHHDCMEHFDDYLVEKEPDMKVYSENIMKLAILNHDLCSDPSL